MRVSTETRKRRRVRKYSVKYRASTLWSEIVRVLVDSKRETPTLLQNAWEGDVDTCVYCGMQPASTIDHIFPVVRNGLPTGYASCATNLVPACHTCNSSKGNRDWKTWMQSRFGDDCPRIKPIDEFVQRTEPEKVSEVNPEILTILRRACYETCAALDDLTQACAKTPEMLRNHVETFRTRVSTCHLLDRPSGTNGSEAGERWDAGRAEQTCISL